MYSRGDIQGGYTLINDGNLPRYPTQQRRPSGIHLSGILSKIHGYSDVVIPESPTNQKLFKTSNLMELGVMFEFALKHRLNELYPDRYLTNPPTLYKDGVYLTPDMYNLDRDAYGEVKLTTKSARACPGGVDDEDFRFAYWESQLKSYCYADGCNTGQLMICHVMGLYKFLNKQRYSIEEILADDSVFNIWERTYSDEELIGNWAVILAHKVEIRYDR